LLGETLEELSSPTRVSSIEVISDRMQLGGRFREAALEVARQIGWSFFMHLSPTLLTAIPLLGTMLFAQSSGQEKSQADHMEHRFDNPKQLAKSFDDPTRDALSPVRSLAYFLPVIDELLAHPAPDNYLEYLRLKLCRIAEERGTPAKVQKKTFSDDR
jgi:hypothetical protein